MCESAIESGILVEDFVQYILLYCLCNYYVVRSMYRADPFSAKYWFNVFSYLKCARLRRRNRRNRVQIHPLIRALLTVASSLQKLLCLNVLVCILCKGTASFVQIIWAVRFVSLIFLTFACAMECLTFGVKRLSKQVREFLRALHEEGSSADEAAGGGGGREKIGSS